MMATKSLAFLVTICAVCSAFSSTVNEREKLSAITTEVLRVPTDTSIGTGSFDKHALQCFQDIGSRMKIIELLVERAERQDLATEIMCAHRHVFFIWRVQEANFEVKVEIQIGFDAALRPKNFTSSVKRFAKNLPTVVPFTQPKQPEEPSEPHKK